MKLIEIPIVHVGTHTARSKNVTGKYDFDTILGQETVWLNPDFIISIQEESASRGWHMIEHFRAKHSFSKDDLAPDPYYHPSRSMTYGVIEPYREEWRDENPYPEWMSGKFHEPTEECPTYFDTPEGKEWMKQDQEKWKEARNAWEQTFCDKHGFLYFEDFQKAWLVWEELHYLLLEIPDTELCPPHRKIYVQVGSDCEEYRTLESIPDLLARINPGSHEALVAAFAAGGNR